MGRSLLSMRSRMSISYLILRRRVSAVSKDVPQARMPFSADKEGCMPLWTIDASAVAEDSRWQDFTIWAGVVVRSEEHTSELQTPMRTSNAVIWLQKKETQEKDT